MDSSRGRGNPHTPCHESLPRLHDLQKSSMAPWPGFEPGSRYIASSHALSGGPTAPGTLLAKARQPPILDRTILPGHLASQSVNKGLLKVFICLRIILTRAQDIYEHGKQSLDSRNSNFRSRNIKNEV